jgi:hypothetical protein
MTTWWIPWGNRGMPTLPTLSDPDAGQPTAPVLLDTHVWVWWLNGDDRLRASARSTLAALSQGRGGLYVAAISV